MKYQILDWDSNFFGVTVARIEEPDLNEHELSKILFELTTSRVNLVYWPSKRELKNEVAKKLNGNFVDKKTTFTINFNTLFFDKTPPTDKIESYTKCMSISDIKSLAIQSGEYSRFAKDLNILREKFVALYSIWINRSLNREIAEEVLVIKDGEKIVGMVTLGNKNGLGDIGLIAVDSNYRGKKYGEKLVRAAQYWFIENKYKFGQVVTQGANIPACNLYKKCGYSIEKIEYFYHFWL